MTAARALTASIPQSCTATRLPDTPHLLRQACAVPPSAPSSTASDTTRELSGVLPTPAPPPPCPAAAPVRGRGASRALDLPKPKETTTATPVRLSAGAVGSAWGGPVPSRCRTALLRTWRCTRMTCLVLLCLNRENCAVLCLLHCLISWSVASLFAGRTQPSCAKLFGMLRRGYRVWLTTRAGEVRVLC